MIRYLKQSEDSNYFNWDEQAFKVTWSKSPLDAISMRGEGPVVIDEIHKDQRWKGCSSILR